MVPRSLLLSQRFFGDGHGQTADSTSTELPVVLSAWPLLVQQLLVAPDAVWGVQLHSFSCLQALCLDAPVTASARGGVGSPLL